MSQSDTAATNKPASKSAQLRAMIHSTQLNFLLEAHSGVSAKIAEEAGFEGIWASGLSIAAAHGVRDNNELSWTQVLDALEFMNDSVSIPVLLDGDTGYGNFNNLRRLVSKLESRGIAGVCIEDKSFPKANSFIDGQLQPLADIDEFSGKIKAGKDAQQDPSFNIVARVEAFIAGWGLGEALKRAEAYRQAGADAILIHSALSRPDEILSFTREWANRSPVVIVPTKYYGTPTEVFETAGISIVIWANHLMRGSVSAMQDIARTIKQDRTLIGVESRIASVSEIFRLQGSEELKQAEDKYLPARTAAAKAIILAAAQGGELGELTAHQPKALVPISGRPLLNRLTDTLNSVGIKDITVVRGFKKESVSSPSWKYVDNDEHETTHAAYSLSKAVKGLKGTALVSYGDILFDKYVPMSLLENQADFAIAVDASWTSSANAKRYIELVQADRVYSKYDFDRPAALTRMTPVTGDDTPEGVTGEWMGLLKVSERGLYALQTLLANLEGDAALRSMRMSEVLNLLLDQGQRIDVLYFSGRWFDVDEIKDVLQADAFLGDHR